MDKKTQKYVSFFLIGVFTFCLSGYILRGTHPPKSILLMVLIYWILFAAGLLVLREFSPGFIVRGFIISFGALLLVSAGFFALGAYNHIHSAEYWIEAEKLETTPEKYAVVPESEIGEYPVMGRELKTGGQGFRVGADEWDEVRSFLLLKESNIIKVDDNYYQVHLSASTA